MNGMVSTNTQRVAVAGYDPYAEFGSGGFQARRNSSCPSMNGMHTIGIHIIRKPAAATNAGNNNNIFARNTDLRHYFLNLRKNGIISTSGAPAHFLVSSKIFGRQRNGNGATLIMDNKIPANYNIISPVRWNGFCFPME